MAILIKTDNTITDIYPINKHDFSLKELQDYVKGHIEIVPLNQVSLLVVNAEGKLENLPRNNVATAIYETMLDTNDFIVGNALICKSKEIL